MTGSPADIIAASVASFSAAVKEVEATFDIQAKLLLALIDAHAALAPRREVLAAIEVKRAGCEFLSIIKNYLLFCLLSELIHTFPALCRRPDPA